MRRTMTSMFAIALLAALALGACSDRTPPQTKLGEPGAEATKSAEAVAAAEAAKEVILNGAGATFPYPIYAKWADTYNKVTGLKLNYQSIGSGGGITQIKAKTVDFGASDAPLTLEDLAEAGLVQFPLVMGGVVPVVNLEGIAPGQLRLDAATLSDIFLGKIKIWSDEKIQALNPDVKLPKAEISVVHRADGSGTTWIFTNYLDKVSPEWHAKVGTGKAVEWPIGIGGKGNEGVAAYVQRVNGAIGYVEFAYAVQNGMAHVQLKNKGGNFVAPTFESFQAAAASADWKASPGFYVVLTDQAGADSWPITGASFILVYKDQADAALARRMLEFFDWCYAHGAPAAKELQYIPIPDAVADLVRDEWKASITSFDKPVWQ
jgi:phosphate transport system substrate-binding protein